MYFKSENSVHVWFSYIKLIRVNRFYFRQEYQLHNFPRISLGSQVCTKALQARPLRPFSSLHHSRAGPAAEALLKATRIISAAQKLLVKHRNFGSFDGNEVKLGGEKKLNYNSRGLLNQRVLTNWLYMHSLWPNYLTTQYYSALLCKIFSCCDNSFYAVQ